MSGSDGVVVTCSGVGNKTWPRQNLVAVRSEFRESIKRYRDPLLPSFFEFLSLRHFPVLQMRLVRQHLFYLFYCVYYVY